ncbi:MAG: FAD-dependent oxidoreductase [Sulfitobacter sp.]
MRVVIVGAGILGASLAYALSRRGAQVTVVDAATVAAGATGQSFGWINASFFADAAHFALRAEGIEAHRRLCRDLDLPVTWSGCLCWEEQGAALEARASALSRMGYGVEILSKPEIAKREPHLCAPEAALYFEAEGAAEPAALAATLLAASGARVMSGCPATEIVTEKGAVRGLRIPGGVLLADRVIVAGGTGSTALLAPLGVALPMLHRPGVIFRTQVVPPVLAHVCVAPVGEFRQTPQGQIVMPTAVSHQSDESETIAERPDVLAAQACARLQDLLPDVPLHWQDVALAARPVPRDGLPVIGACGPAGLFATVMHSGITLAGVVAEVVSAEVMDQPLSNAQTAMVAPYRPARFQDAAPTADL